MGNELYLDPNCSRFQVMMKMRDRKVPVTEQKVKKGITFGPFWRTRWNWNPRLQETSLIHVTFHTSEGGKEGIGIYLRTHFPMFVKLPAVHQPSRVSSDAIISSGVQDGGLQTKVWRGLGRVHVPNGGEIQYQASTKSFSFSKWGPSSFMPRTQLLSPFNRTLIILI